MSGIMYMEHGCPYQIKVEVTINGEHAIVVECSHPMADRWIALHFKTQKGLRRFCEQINQIGKDHDGDR